MTFAAHPVAHDPALELWVPEADVAAPEVTIVAPAKDEALTIGEFLDWCWEGLRRAGVSGEVLVVDSSSDGTARLAVARGARVLRAPCRGLGRAYLDALPLVRGEWVMLGDCDLTYDFRELAPFVARLKAGDELVLGTRLGGFIEPGAMPSLHRYFGTPLTTAVLNALCGTRYTDIHCGMRAVSRQALRRLDLRSQGWAYASEMLVRAASLGLRTSEVPIRFLKDRPGRLSHHRRAGWWSPWKAGVDNVVAMLAHRFRAGGSAPRAD